MVLFDNILTTKKKQTLVLHCTSCIGNIVNHLYSHRNPALTEVPDIRRMICKESLNTVHRAAEKISGIL
jgi:hypothetical protein